LQQHPVPLIPAAVEGIGLDDKLQVTRYLSAAGAILDAAVLRAARQQNLDPADYLARNDAYHFFQPLDALIRTGPTHTNVCDVRVVVVDRLE
jgi:glycerate-2-kinase